MHRGFPGYVQSQGRRVGVCGEGSAGQLMSQGLEIAAIGARRGTASSP